MRRYVFERFLARLGQSNWRDRLVLKGAMALIAVTHNYVRATRGTRLKSSKTGYYLISRPGYRRDAGAANAQD